ncbi:MAG: quinone-dependent dihydroorotate dehydrogenase, partial [Xanthobacteraceae bacterium]
VKAGASLLQLYSGLVFRGVGLVAQIKADLLAVLRRGPVHSLSELVGAEAAAMTAERWPE